MLQFTGVGLGLNSRRRALHGQPRCLGFGRCQQLREFGSEIVLDLAECDAILGAAAQVAERAGVQAAVHARQGDPADAILDVAEETRADLIVVGNKGMTGAKRFLLGSVPNKVSHHAPCSVLIIRTT